MSRLRVLIFFASALATNPLGGTAVPGNRPNMVLIIADDMGAPDCSPYGHPRIRTPNLHRLAREGMRFTRAFVTCSSCSPSRASILTGRYPHQTGASHLHQPLPEEQVGFTELLRQAGYWTAAVGKWHLGNPAKTKFDLVRDQPMPIPAGLDESSRRRMQREAASGCTQWIPVMRARPRDRPFFLWLAAVDPHRDYQPDTIPLAHTPDDAMVPPYLPDTPAVRRDFAAYYDEIARLDHYVGLVLDELDRQGVASNTLVMFLSDNGRPFPRCKTTVYDSGIQTPLLVRWPGKVKANAVCDRLVSTVDLAPTFLLLAGMKPSSSFTGADMSVLFRQPTRRIRRYIFAEQNWHDFEARSRAVRSERYKYIRNDYPDLPLTPPVDVLRSPTFQELRRLNTEGKLTPAQRAPFIKPRPVEELYDLASDPDELNNLAARKEHATALASLRRALDRWTKETGDEPPDRRRPDAFDRETGEPLKNAGVP